MNINKSINSIVKTKKAPSFLLPRKSLVVVAVISVFSLLIFGFWYTFQSIALNPPTQNPPTGGGAIGVASDAPANSLSVASNGDVSIGGGSGKLNVGTIDPVYDISGTKYATYVSGMIGQKEETTGVVKLQKFQIPNSKSQTNSNCQNTNDQNGLGFGACDLELGGTFYSYTIDFSRVEQGSDLWLFRQVTDFGSSADGWKNLTVLISPGFTGQIWYEKYPDKNQLIFYASPLNSQFSIHNSPEISYRLTAPRFDWYKWTNIAHDQTMNGLFVR